MASTALSKINARVKQLAKKHPGKKRVTLQKQAGAEYRAGKLGGAKKRHAKKVHHKRIAAPRKRRRVGSTNKSHRDGIDRKKVDITIGSVSSHLSAAKKKLKTEIGMKMAERLTAKTKKQKNKLAKQIREKASLYKKL
jgi:hypothetical protein